ncbi:hypothetical protein FISHEDRAFT_54932 [Fistulina hepatica ATCC 64428]|uniref:Uncharacterized protein n=1 Tax=Fistulina hepatica ATCC 64428 TaxID=1128425 RepID=A0A0D7AR60_9AGAR|nr:hypothetical protein FISHEDRAFT_54932 [Fistulina hepatica ATCC 64428]
MRNIASGEARNWRPQDLEIYRRLYYGVLMKGEVDACYKAMKAASLAHKEANGLGDTLTVGEGQSLSMSAHWEVMLEGWQCDKNDPVILRAIQDVRESQEREGTNDDVLTTEEIQRWIQEIGPLICAVHDFVYNHMGWCAYTKFGGVNEVGILKMYSVDVAGERHKDIEKNIPLRLRKAEWAEKGNGSGTINDQCRIRHTRELTAKGSSLSELGSGQARTMPSSAPTTVPQFQTPVPASDSFLPDIPVDMGLLEGNSVQEMMALYDNPNLWDTVTVSDDSMSNFTPGGSTGVLSDPFDGVMVSDHSMSDFIPGESAGVLSDPFYMMTGWAAATHSDSSSSSSSELGVLPFLMHPVCWTSPGPAPRPSSQTSAHMMSIPPEHQPDCTPYKLSASNRELVTSSTPTQQQAPSGTFVPQAPLQTMSVTCSALSSPQEATSTPGTPHMTVPYLPEPPWGQVPHTVVAASTNGEQSFNLLNSIEHACTTTQIKSRMTQRAKNGGGKGKRAPKKMSEVQKACDHMAASVHNTRQWAATITSETAEEGLVNHGVSVGETCGIAESSEATEHTRPTTAQQLLTENLATASILSSQTADGESGAGNRQTEGLQLRQSAHVPVKRVLDKDNNLTDWTGPLRKRQS